MLKLNWDVSTFLALFPAAERPQTWSLDFNHLVLGSPLTWLFLFQFNSVKPLKLPLCLFVRLPLLAQQRASSTTDSSGAKGPQKLPWRKEHFPFPSLKPRSDLKVVSYSEVIEQSGCSLNSSMKSLPRVILSALLQVSQSYILFKRLKRSSAPL